MKAARSLALVGSVGLALSFAAVAGPALAAKAPSPSRVSLRGTATPAKERAHPAGKVAGGASVKFDLSLKLRNAAGAQAFVKSVSSVGSKSYHKFLTDKQWLSRFGPTPASISAAESWLKSQGFKVGALPKT